jgi:hypothetical protein
MAEMNKRVAMKFCLKAGLSATETLVLVQKAYGNKVLNRSNVFRWYAQFLDGLLKVRLNFKKKLYAFRAKGYMLGIRNTRNMADDTHTHTHTQND